MSFDVRRQKNLNLRSVPKRDFRDTIGRMGRERGDIEKDAAVRDCVKNGYAPRGYGLADFSIVRVGDLFHLFHIPRVPGGHCLFPCHEHWIGHAVSRDLDTWVTRDTPITADPKHYYERSHVWAPFVCERDGIYYLYYTGLSDEPTQVLCMATSSDPDLDTWEKSRDNPITPLTGFDWHWLNENGHVRHARDPHVVGVDGHYLMAYTAMHKGGCPAVGGLVSDDLLHWEDIGPILYRPLDPATWWPESVNIQRLPDGRWALLPSQSPGLAYYSSRDPHSWHGALPSHVEYVNGDRDQITAVEVVARRDARSEWLVAFFESRNNRLFLGVLDLSRHPWRVRRIDDRGEISDWLRKE